ncbi:hypothetical protein BJ912DRAFT_962779 [Pholiota molesta]|nr:hypothetical protein BJ912DRAFT_962779 [Pholiota molesta]
MVVELLHLPQELRLRILANLDAISLNRCAMTCKPMHETLRSSSRLKYIVQLHLDGLEDAGTTTIHSKLILRLLHHRQAWHALDWRGYDVIDTKTVCRAYELVGDAFAHANGQNLEIGRTLRRTWPEIAIEAFAMDPAQDMIAIVEDNIPYSHIRIHIRAISTTGPHPLARQSLLRFTMNADPFLPTIHIWDWTTSDLLVDSSTAFDPLLPPSRVSSFDLLDSAHCFVISEAGSGSIRLYKLVRSPSVTGRAIHVATLHLPPTTIGTNIANIAPYTGPIEAKPLPHTPFMINDGTAYTKKRSRSGSFNLFVHQRVFERYCVERADHGDTPLDIPWSEWGPPNTRLINPACTRVQGFKFRNIHGQRVVCPVYHDLNEDVPLRAVPGPTSWVQVLDFSRAAVLAAKSLSSEPPPLREPPDKSQVLISSGVVRARDLRFFKDDVETRLPFVRTTVNLGQKYSAFMIYGDGIVGVRVRTHLSCLHSGSLLDGAFVLALVLRLFELLLLTLRF